MRNRKTVKAILVAAGVAAAVAVPTASADAATSRPDVHVQQQVYFGPSQSDCVKRVAIAEVQYGAADGGCYYDGFNWHGWINLD